MALHMDYRGIAHGLYTWNHHYKWLRGE
uniref:Uncharacterized protein n=1 Tax=Rhizophora mucronata TaxID=61149 RepID=A0A2P2IZI0_RHIMU